MEGFFISDVCDARRPRDSLKKIAAISLLISLLIIRFPGHLFAYEEPDSFAGLKFGEDLTTQIEKCPSVDFSSLFLDKQKVRVSGTRCYWPVGTPAVFYSLYNMGEIQHEVKDIWAHLLDSKLAAVTLIFNSSKTSVLLSILRERYGEPTAQSVQPWVSKGGVKTTSTLVIWKGRNVSITLTERSHTIEEGSIRYSTEAWIEHLKRTEAEKIKKGASGL